MARSTMAPLDTETEDEKATQHEFNGRQRIPVLHVADRWAAALERLTDEDRGRFHLAKILSQRSGTRDVLPEVLEATRLKMDECMKKRWKVVIRGHTIILRDVLEKISVWVGKVVKFGDIAVQYDPGQAALPWAAIRVVLQATVNDIEVFGWVLNSLEDIANLLATCRIFELRYLQQDGSEGLDISDQLSNALVTLYTHILRYLSVILHRYSQGSAVRFMKSVASPATDFEAKYAPIHSARVEAWSLAQLAEAEKSERIQASLDRIEYGQDLTAAALFETLGEALRELREPISRASIQLAGIQDGLERETRARILKAISSIPYSIHHKNAKRGRLEGSGQWLLEKPEYESWRESSTSSVLWLHGIPGSGKTKLTSLVIDKLSGRDNLAYFYCMRNPAEPQRGRGDQILASLVRQLAGVSSDKPLLAPVVTQYEDAISGLCEFEDQAWTANESAQVLLALMEEYPAATIVLDALDEVNQEDRQDLLNILARLLQNSPNLLKIFISSRDNYDIALHFEGSPNVYIEADDNAGDISSFIDDRLEAARLLHNRLPKDLETKIRETLLRGARGMFRWVDLQIQSLRPLKVAADIEARLGALPATLEGSYWEIYQAIQESGDHAAALADFTFQWLIFARDTVTIEVFACIASSNVTQQQHMQSGTTTTTTTTAGFSADEVIDVCANLVVSRNGSFEFAHLSVREFFEGIHKRDVGRLLPAHGNSCIATACLRHLRIHIITLGPELIKSYDKSEEKYEEKNGEESEENLEENPEDKSEDKSEDKYDEKFNSEPRDQPHNESDGTQAQTPGEKPDEEADDRGLVEQEDGVSTSLSHETNLTAVRYAALLWVYHACESQEMRIKEPLATTIKDFLGEGAPGVSFKTSSGLQVWCRLVQSILKHEGSGQDVLGPLQVDRLKDSSVEPANPFWLACLHDWYDVAEFLYACKYNDVDESRELLSLGGKGSDAFPDSKVPPLCYAILRRNLVLISKIQLHSTASLLQLKNQPEFKPLITAAQEGDQELVAVLLGMEHGGLDVEAEAFASAAGHNRCEIMKMLLAHDSRILAKSGNRPVREACVAGQADAVTFLLDRNASLLHSGLFLCRVVFMGHHDVLKILLERQVGVGYLSKALIISVSHGDRAATDLLLRFGAQKEPPAVTREVKIGSRVTAIRLIEAGYDIRGRYLERRRTPLHYAVERGYEDVVAALLSADNSTVNVYDADRKTPLHLAAARGHAGCVGPLLSHGADALAEDARGRIPLDLAEEGNHELAGTLIRDWMVKLKEELQKEQDELRRV